jgi:hypothetical protein
MFVLAASSPIVDWSAIWKICLVTLVAGGGVVVVYGFLLIGLKIANSPRDDSTQATRSRVAGFFLSFVCGVIVFGVIVVGIYAITQKPSTAKPKPKTSAAVLTAPGHQRRLVAWAG